LFRKNAVIEINDNYLITHQVTRKNFHLIYKSDNYRLDILRDIYIDLKHKRVSILLEGEEINIKLMTLPKVKKEALYDLIKNELFYYFKDLDSIVFNYNILREHKSKFEILVFCINERKINFIEKRLNSSIKVQGVYLIQFSFLNYFKLKIKEKNYGFVFVYRENLYFLYCIENKVLHSNVYKIVADSIEPKNLLYNFMQNCKILYDKEVTKVYFANCDSIQLFNDIFDKTTYENLGDIEETGLINSVALKRS
jgi:hypothetical protein